MKIKRTKQEVAAEATSKGGYTPELEKEWDTARDGRAAPNWDKQSCICGTEGWCGRDSHRPSFGVDDETNGTIYYDKKGVPVYEDDEDEEN